MRVAKDYVGKTVTLGFLPAGRRQQTRAPRCVREIPSSPHQRCIGFRVLLGFLARHGSRTNGRRLEGRDERI